MGHRVDLAKQAKWLATVQRWQRSGLSVRAFCRQQQVNEASFYDWRRALRERGLLEERMPAFVRVSTPLVESADNAIEVVLPQGRSLRVRAGFDADALLQLVRLLEAPAC